MEAKPLKYHDKQEEIWVVQQGEELMGASVSELTTPDLPGLDHSKSFISTKIVLHRPSLAPIYGGPTLLEALWNEMDRLMEGLMTGQTSDDVCGQGNQHGDPLAIGERCEHEDNGDKYRAQELAWVLAIVTNAYDPDVNKIRSEAMRRWEAAMEEDNTHGEPPR